MKIYLIGSLRNELVPSTADRIRQEAGCEVFDDWFAAGPEADDYWKTYEVSRGRNYAEALRGYAAQHVFNFDRYHLDTSDAAVLLLPAGRSGHLELGYMVGRGRPGFILLDQGYVEEGRFDVMYNFATGVFTDIKDLINELKRLDEPAPSLPLW